MGDLAGVICILLLLLVLVYFLIPRRHHGEAAWRTKCGSNLRQIGQAIRQYAIDHNGDFPRTRYDPADPAPRFFTGVEADDPFGADGPAPNDVTAAAWLVLRQSV